MRKKIVSTALRKLPAVSGLFIFLLYLTGSVQGETVFRQGKNESGSGYVVKRAAHLYQQQIRGVVTDENGAPLAGVSVKVKGRDIGVVTGSDGRFSLTVPGNAILEVSYVGYQNQEIIVGSRVEFNIQLQSSAKGLNEVVVVGYGTQKRQNLTGAVTQISAEVLESRPVDNVSQALQGTVPNLSVDFNDGRPGSSGKLNIRGFTSINGGTPLVLVDGVPSEIDLVNPSDVATISVLKDASSAAIYGARAAYGVILITTKSGSAGKLRINYNGNFSLATPTTSHDFMTDGYEMAKLVDQAQQISRGVSYTGYTDADYEYLLQRREDPSLPDVMIKNVNGVDRYVWYGSTDWWHHFFLDQKPSMSHALSFSGGTEKIDFLLSGRYFHQDGMFRINRDKYDAYFLRAKVNAHLTPWLTISDNLQFSANTYKYPGLSLNDAFVYFGVHMISPWLPQNPDGTFTYMPATNNQGLADGRAAEYQYGKSKSVDKNFDLINTVTATIDPFEGLSIVGSYSYNLNNFFGSHRRTVAPWSNTPGVINYVGTDYFTESWDLDQYHVVNAYATYSKNIGSHSFKIMGGYNQELKKYYHIGGRANNLISDDLNALALGSSGQEVSSDAVEWALRGFFGRLNYNYANKYLLELNGRYDGSSHFPEGNQYGFFPSVSAGWRISEEQFFDRMRNTISELKLRASYGSLGNQSLSSNLRSQNYPYIPLMNTGNSNWLMGGEKSQYLRVGNPVTPDLAWERTTSINGGIDIGFLNNRLNVSFDVYDRKTLDMLIPGKTLSATFGASSPKQNAGDLQTRGFDLSIKWEDRVTDGSRPFSYYIGAILSDFRSYITRFDNPSNLLNNYYVGQRIGEIWGYTTDGYFLSDDDAAKYPVNQDYVNNMRMQSPGDGRRLQAGDLKYVDLNGDDVINDGKNTLEDHGDLSVLGNSLPRYSFGIRAGAEYAGFDLSVFFQGVGRQHWYPGPDTYMFWGPFSRPYHSFFPLGFENLIWSPENPNSYFPLLRGFDALNARNSLTTINNRYLQNTRYIRLKNLTIGYSLPSSLLQRWSIDKVRVYFSGENLFMLTGIESDYIDPQQISKDPNGGVGSTNARTYPFFKTYSFGLDITL